MAMYDASGKFESSQIAAKLIVSKADQWVVALGNMKRNRQISEDDFGKAKMLLQYIREPMSELASRVHDPNNEQDALTIRRAIANVYRDTEDTPAYVRHILLDTDFGRLVLRDLNDNELKGRLADAYEYAGGDPRDFWNHTFANVDQRYIESNPTASIDEPEPVRPQQPPRRDSRHETHTVHGREVVTEEPIPMSRGKKAAIATAVGTTLLAGGYGINEFTQRHKPSVFDMGQEAIEQRTGDTTLTESQKEMVRRFNEATSDQMRGIVLEMVEKMHRPEQQAAIVGRMYMDALNDDKGKEKAIYLAKNSPTLRAMKFNFEIHPNGSSSGYHRNKGYLELADEGFLNEGDRHRGLPAQWTVTKRPGWVDEIQAAASLAQRSQIPGK